MEYLIQFQLNVYALLILIILLVTLKFRSKVRSFTNKLLEYIVILNMAAVIIEPFSWIFDGKEFIGAYFLEYATNFALILIGSILAALVLSYVDYYVFRDKQRIRKRAFYILPVIFTFIMLVVNFFYPLYFDIIEETNTFSQGDYMWIQYVMIVGLYIFMMTKVLVNRHITSPRTLNTIALVFLIPIIGMIIQALEYQLYSSWTYITLSVLIIYIYLETTSGEKDYLTKLYSRKSYEKYFKNLVERNKLFSIVLIDLNEFKNINDTKGHLKGDTILFEFSSSLLRAFPLEFVCRLGGDEFLIVIEHALNINEGMEEVYRLLKRFDDINLQNLSFSYGVQEYDGNLTFDKMYHMADQKMYKMKHGE